MSHILKTTLIWHDSRGGEHESDVEVEYDRYPGFAGDMTDPPHDATIEVIGITSRDEIPPTYIDLADFSDECMQHWAEQDEVDRERAAEDRAERAREDRA